MKNQCLGWGRRFRLALPPADRPQGRPGSMPGGFSILSIAMAADAPVTATQEGNAFTLSNDIVTAQIKKTTGDLM